MATPKYKQYVDEMFALHQEKMMKFMLLNQDYAQNKREHKSLFDREGAEVKEIVEDWCGRLCQQMEKGKHGAYSNKLEDKFLAEVQKYFPYYHEIGITIR